MRVQAKSRSRGQPIVFYAVDNSRLHLHLAQLSLGSLRRQNVSVPVRVFAFGPIQPGTQRKFEGLGAEVTHLPRLRESGLSPCFAKWLALAHMNTERALYVDTDTWFFDDPAKLLGIYRSKDFYAREEYGTRPGVGYQLLGNCVLAPQIHPAKRKALAKLLDFKPKPIFNTGVMIFNQGFAARIAQEIPEIINLHRLFAEKPGFYPAENAHIEDEVIASIIFGKLRRFSWGRISKEVSPWYCEWSAGVVPQPGMVMHFWSKYSPFFVREFLGKAELDKLPFLIPVEEHYREY